MIWPFSRFVLRNQYLACDKLTDDALKILNERYKDLQRQIDELKAARGPWVSGVYKYEAGTTLPVKTTEKLKKKTAAKRKPGRPKKK